MAGGRPARPGCTWPSGPGSTPTRSASSSPARPSSSRPAAPSSSRAPGARARQGPGGGQRPARHRPERRRAGLCRPRASSGPAPGGALATQPPALDQPDPAPLLALAAPSDDGQATEPAEVPCPPPRAPHPARPPPGPRPPRPGPVAAVIQAGQREQPDWDPTTELAPGPLAAGGAPTASLPSSWRIAHLKRVRHD